MSFPWETSNERSQLVRRMGAYTLAMARAEDWDGGSLTRRRAELRELAERCGMQLQVELLLKHLEREHRANPGHPDTVTHRGAIVRDGRRQSAGD